MKLSSHKLPRQTGVELPLTSMIDVVFLLLIYFLTTSGFVRTERELDPRIKADGSAGKALSDLEVAVVDIVRSESGFVYRLGSREVGTQEELTRILRQFGNRAEGAFVRAVDEAPFDLTAAAIQACKSARFLTVTYVPMDTHN